MVNYEEKVKEVGMNKKNYPLFFSDTALFTNAMTFLSINAVITYFLNTLGASTLQISLASALVSIGPFISQPMFTKKAMETVYKARAFTKILYTQRLFFLVFILSIPFIAVSKPGIMIILFLICWGIFNFFTGAYSPFYMSLISKMVPHQHRGRLLGFAGATGNLIALGSSYLISILLKRIPYPYNYTCIFVIGIMFLLLDVVVFQLMKEPPDKLSQEEMSYWVFIRYIPKLLKNNTNVLKIILANCLLSVSNVALGYFVLFAIRTYEAKAEQVAVFTAVTVISNIFGSMSFGLIADKYGHRRVLKIAGLLGAFAGMVIISVHSIYAVYAAFALSTLCVGGYNLSSGMLVIQNSPREQVPIYISASGMITLVVSSLFMILSGYLIDIVSFVPVFIVISIAGAMAFMVFNFIRQES